MDAMLRRIPAKQFREWYLYEKLEPFGELGARYRTASIVRMVHGAAGRTYSRPLSLDEATVHFDFVDNGVTTTVPAQGQTVEQKISIARAIVMAFNARGINE